MAFDIIGAKNAGYSDTEIADYLSSQNGFDAAGARKAGYSDQEIIGHVSGSVDVGAETPTPPRIFSTPSKGTQQDVMGIASPKDRQAAETAQTFVKNDIPAVAKTFGAKIGGGMEQSIGGAMRAYGEEDTNRFNVDDNQLAQTRAGRYLNELTAADNEQRATLAQRGTELGNEGRAVIQAAQEDQPVQTRAGRILDQTAQSIGSNLPGMAATMVTGSPAVGLSMMGLQSFGQTYDESRAKGLNIADATMNAAIQGGTEVATEMLPFVALSKYLKTDHLSKEVLKHYLSDIPGEHLATAIQNASDAAYDTADMTPQQRIDAAADYLASNKHKEDQIDTFFTTVLQGAVMGGVAKVARVGNALAPEAQQTPQPAPSGPLSRAVGMADTRAVAPVQSIGSLVAERRGLAQQPAQVAQPVVEQPAPEVALAEPVISRAAAPVQGIGGLVAERRKLAENQGNPDAQISPVAGLSEPVDTSVSPASAPISPTIGVSNETADEGRQDDRQYAQGTESNADGEGQGRDEAALQTVQREGTTAEGEPGVTVSAHAKSVTAPDFIGMGYGNEEFPAVLESAKAELAKGNVDRVTTNKGEVINLVHYDDGGAQGESRILALNDNGELVGDLEYSTGTMENGRGFNPQIDVAEPYRRKGIATALYDAAESRGGKIPALDEPQVRTPAGQAFREARAGQAPRSEAPATPAEPDFALILANLEKQTAVEKGKGNKGHWSVSDFQEYLKQSYPSVAGMPKVRILSALRTQAKGKPLSPVNQEVIDAFRHDEEALRQKYGTIEQVSQEIADEIDAEDYDSAADFFDAIIARNEGRTDETRNAGEDNGEIEALFTGGAERDTQEGQRKTEATDDAGGWQQEVAVSAAKKVPTIGGVQKQGGRRQSTSDLMDAFTPEPPSLFSLKEQAALPHDSHGDFETGKPVTFNFIHNTESATKIHGKPKKDSPYDRGLEPSGRYVNQVDDPSKLNLGPNLISGELTFKNPLVIKGEGWKRQLSAAFGGKRGKALSKAIIAAGHDGVVTIADSRHGKYISEILDLTTFDESKAKYSTDENATADLTLERVQSSFPSLPVTEDNGTFTVTTPSGIPIRISKVGEIEFGPEQRAAAEKEYGRPLRADERPAAEYKPLDHGAIINLTERGVSELSHESFHAAMNLALTERQKAAVLRTFGNEEKAAAEYQRLKESGALETRKGNYWLSKIYRFLRSLRQLISPTAKGVMEDVASGKVWGKAHKGDGGARYAFVPANGDEEGAFSDLSDKKTKVELDDSGAEVPTYGNLWDMREKVGQGSDIVRYPLHHVMDHEVFNRFPWARDIVLETHFDTEHRGMGENGHYDANRGTIVLHVPDHIDTSEEPALDKRIKGTLLHELQHAIQEKSGFAVGGSTRGMGHKIAEARHTLMRGEIDDKISRLVSERKVEAEIAVSKLSDAEKESMAAPYDDARDLYDSDKDFYIDAMVSSKTNAKVDAITKVIASLRRQLKELTRLADINSATDGYIRLAGEEEARRAANRADMTASERVGKPYDLSDIDDPSDLIVDTRSGNMSYSLRSDFTNYNPTALKSTLTVHPKVQALVGSVFNNGRNVSPWMRTVGTMYHMAEKLAAEGKPQFKAVFDKGQEFLTDVSTLALKAESLAPDIFPKMGTGKGLFHNLPRKDAIAIAEPLYQGTLFGGADPKKGKVFSDTELKRIFNLSDHQIDLYKQARAATDQSLDDMAKSLIARNAKEAQVGFDREMDLTDMAAEVKSAIQDKIDTMKAALEQLEDDYKNTPPDPDAKVQKKLDKAHNRAVSTQEAAIELHESFIANVENLAYKTDLLKRRGYFPLMRFGQYTVTMKDHSGKVEFFGLYESAYKARLMTDALHKENPGMNVVQSVMGREKFKLFAGMNLEGLQLFAEHMKAEDSEAYQEYLKQAMNNRSAMKRLIHRKGTEGYSEDAVRTLANFITSNARHASTQYHLHDMRKLASEVPEDTQGDVQDQAVKLYEYLSKPAEEASKLRGYLFFHYLGGSLASGIVNMTQPVMMTMPYLASKTTAAKAAKHLTKASKMSFTDPAKVGGELGVALRRAESEGATAPQEIYQLTAMASNKLFAANPYWNAGMKVWGSFFSIAEAFNRRVTFIASFRISREKGLSPDRAYTEAVKAITETQGIYNKGNRPKWGRGTVGGTLFTFKQFSVMYLELFNRLPAKQKGIMLGILWLMAGLQGMPFAEDAEDVIDTIGQWAGFATNSKRWINQQAEDSLGKDAGDFVTQGISSVLPLDLQGRMGLQNLIPGTGILKQSATDKGRDVKEFFGPAGGLLASLGDALTLAAQGLPGRAALAASPRAVQNYAQGGETMWTGATHDKYGRKGVELSKGEAALKLTGFNPSRVAEEGQIKSANMQDVNLLRVRKNEISTQWAYGIAHRDSVEIAEAKRKLIEWNAKNPELKMNMGSVVQSARQKARALNTTGKERFLKSMPKEIRRRVIDELG